MKFEAEIWLRLSKKKISGIVQIIRSEAGMEAEAEAKKSPEAEAR